MLKTRILLIMAGILLSALLFLLPKVVVDNDADSVSSTSAESTEHDESDGHDHSEEAFDHNQSIDSAALNTINKVRELFIVAENNEKSITFADSLASLFKQVGKLDSVVKYREWIANNFPNEENVEIAGLACYEAFGYAIDDEKVKYYGDKVKNYLGEILEKHPDRLDLKSKIAMTHISSANPMQGIMMLRDVVEKDPNNIEALFNLGLLSRQSGQLDKAIERFEKILTIDSSHLQARFLLGVTFKDLGMNEQAVEQFEIVKRTDSDPAVNATVNAYLEEIK